MEKKERKANKLRFVDYLLLMLLNLVLNKTLAHFILQATLNFLSFVEIVVLYLKVNKQKGL